MERLQEDQINERRLTQPIDDLARSLLPGPYASDGAVANQISALNEDSLRICGVMWFLGDQASWTEPMQFVVELRPSTDVVQAWTLSVGNAATGFRPVPTGRERRRGWMTPTEWLFVIGGRVGNEPPK
jgi:hypothetical protein